MLFALKFCAVSTKDKQLIYTSHCFKRTLQVCCIHFILYSHIQKHIQKADQIYSTVRLFIGLYLLYLDICHYEINVTLVETAGTCEKTFSRAPDPQMISVPVPVMSSLLCISTFWKL